MGTKELSLSLEHLSVGYNAGSALFAETSLSIRGAHVIALLGRNGCGKTTFLRTLVGQLPPLTGQIIINGIPLSAYGAQRRARQVSFLPSRLACSGALCVRDLVEMALFPYAGWYGKLPDSEERVTQAIDTLGLASMAMRQVGTLSDGERQRAALAMAVAQNTPLLLLDEPTAFLDVSAKAELVHLLHTLAHREGKIVIFSTHDLHTALHFADSLWLIIPNSPLLHVTPEEAMLQGLIASGFNTTHVHFNPYTLSFIPQRNDGEEPVHTARAHLVDRCNDTLRVHCTKQLLQRLHVECVTSPSHAEDTSPHSFTIKVHPHHWELQPQSLEVNTLRELEHRIKQQLTQSPCAYE